MWTGTDNIFVVGMLDHYKRNPRMDSWKIVQKVLRYLQCINEHMLTYWGFDYLNVLGYSDSYFHRSVNTHVINIRLFVSSIWRRNLLEECESVSIYFIHYGSLHFGTTIYEYWLSNSISGFGIVENIDKPLL